MGAIEVTREIRRRLLKTEVLIFAIRESESLVHEYLKAGARGYLLKSDGTPYLLEAIETLTTHRPFFTANVSRTLLRIFSQQVCQGSDNPHAARAPGRRVDH